LISNIDRNRGFTLVEIMLVLVVIGIMLGLASVAFTPNPAKDLQREAQRLQVVLQMAADEAQLQGIEMALAITDPQHPQGRGYQLLRLDNKALQWQPIDSAEYRFHPLNADISLSVSIDGQLLDDEIMQQLRRLQSLQNSAQLQPALLLLSSGEVSPFRIAMLHAQVEQPAIISSDGIAEITLK
jgi:general secretion pathway protein H